jgi:hypothetical protein
MGPRAPLRENPLLNPESPGPKAIQLAATASAVIIRAATSARVRARFCGRARSAPPKAIVIPSGNKANPAGGEFVRFRLEELKTQGGDSKTDGKHHEAERARWLAESFFFATALPSLAA